MEQNGTEWDSADKKKQHITNKQQRKHRYYLIRIEERSSADGSWDQFRFLSIQAADLSCKASGLHTFQFDRKALHSDRPLFIIINRP